MAKQNYTFPGISVFCGRSEEARTIPENNGHVESIRAFGQELARNNIPLIWGAGEFGLMGEVSKATIQAGGKAAGVITRHLLYGEEGCQEGLTLLLIADDMQARKLAFSKLSCAFVVFPGGAGTGDELFEYLAEREYGEHTKPLVLVNLGGYFDLFLEDIRHAVQWGDIPQSVADMIIVVSNETEVLPALKTYFDQNPIERVVLCDVTPDEIRKGFGEDLEMGPAGPEGGRIVMLKDTLIPLEWVGPKYYNKSIMLWCGAQPGSIKNPERQRLVSEMKRFMDMVQAKGMRLIHSGQNSGLKSEISKYVQAKKIENIAVTTHYKIDNGYFDKTLKNRLVRRNEQSVDYALKALSSVFVIAPGGADTREKYFEFLTEVDVDEHNKPVILWNFEGYYDPLLKWLEHLMTRRYLYKKTYDRKVFVAKTAEDVMRLIQEKLA